MTTESVQEEKEEEEIRQPTTNIYTEHDIQTVSRANA